MKNYKIIKYTNGIGKEFYCIKRRRMLVFWTYLKFTKNTNLTILGNLTEEAYMFDSLERAENLIIKIKREGEVNIKGKTIKKL